jgi:hypothetical protein
VLAGTHAVLQAAIKALSGDPDMRLLEPLADLLHQQMTPAHKLIQVFRETGSIGAALCKMYALPEELVHDRSLAGAKVPPIQEARSAPSEL